MATRAHTITTAPAAATHDKSWLAAIPAGTLVAVFDSKAAASGTAVQLAMDSDPSQVWLGNGPSAAEAIARARIGRPFVGRLLRGLSDEEPLVRQLCEQARAGASLVIVKQSGGREISRLDEAVNIVRFGQWAISVVR